MKTVSEVAKEFGVTKMAVYHWIKGGLLHKKERVIGKKERIIINSSDVVKFLKLTKGSNI
jgi:predicted site-specific integrase-resolvase